MARRRRKGYRPGYRDNYWQTAAYNEHLFQMFRDDIINIAISRFKWVNLPKSCDARYLEMTLLYEGQATIAYPRSSEGMFLSLRAVMQDEPNMYGNPKRWRAIGQTGRTDFPCSWANGVFIRDSMTMYPLMTKINVWARELADIVRTAQVNRFHLKMPVIITGAAERSFDMGNIVKQITQGEPVIITTDGINDIDVKVWNTDVEFEGEALSAEFENAWAKVYRELGIDWVSHKSERMIEDEVKASVQPSEFTRLSPIMCRREAAEKLNDRFGKYLVDGDIDVVWNADNLSDNYNTASNLQTILDATGELGGTGYGSVR